MAREPVQWHRPEPPASPHFRLLLGDLGSAADARHAVEAARPDSLYLLAGLSAPSEAYRDPVELIRNNAACVVHVLEATRAIVPDARIVLVSSNQVYESGRSAGGPISEDTPLGPDNPYALSKLAQDLLGWQYHKAYGLRVVRVRPFNHIGPGQREPFVAASFAKQIAEAEAGLRDPVIEVGNLDACRDFSDVRDVVRAYELALLKGEPGEVYNLASGSGVQIRGLLDGLIARSRVPISIRVDPRRLRPVDAPLLIGDGSRFTRQTGWRPQIPLEQTLDDILEEWRSRVRSA